MAVKTMSLLLVSSFRGIYQPCQTITNINQRSHSMLKTILICTSFGILMNSAMAAEAARFDCPKSLNVQNLVIVQMPQGWRPKNSTARISRSVATVTNSKGKTTSKLQCIYKHQLLDTVTIHRDIGGSMCVRRGSGRELYFICNKVN